MNVTAFLGHISILRLLENLLPKAGKGLTNQSQQEDIHMMFIC